jgi:Zn-dependent protease with chaperone function
MYIFSFFKNLFRKANALIIVYLALNITIYVALFGGFSSGVLAGMAVALYLVSLCIALSPIGEFILRIQSGCKKIKRPDYLQRLMPLFNEVYARAKAKDPSISDNVGLYMSNDDIPNAFATGRKTICVTKGFLTFSDEQIKGALAHEFAHLAHKDTDLLLLISVGNMLISAIFVIYRIIINISLFFFVTMSRSEFIGRILTAIFINAILASLIWVWTKIGSLLVRHSSRQNEFEADQFAHELGYGKELCVTLEILESMGSSSGNSFWAQLQSTHPDTDDRIARLQNMGTNYGHSYSQLPATSTAQPQPSPVHRPSPVNITQEWVCSLCGAKTSQQMCPECGQEKPHMKARPLPMGAAAFVQPSNTYSTNMAASEWACSLCGNKSHEKVCPECGQERP